MSEFAATGRAEPDVGVVELVGQLDGRVDTVLDEAFSDAVAAGSPVVLLDFGSVTFINSTGIALVVGVLARARREGREIRVCGLSDHYRHVFEITRLADFMTFFDTQADAVDGAAPSSADTGGSHG